jgi:hypothetical protein
MALQDELNAVYERFLDRDLVDRACGGGEAAKTVIEAISAPLLIAVNRDYEQSHPRIVVVGQETWGWYRTYRQLLDEQSLTGALSEYDKYLQGNRNASPFWQSLAKIRGELLGKEAIEGKRKAILWTNLFKCDDGRMIQSKWREAVLHLQGDVVQEELRILKPDAVLFLTGPEYDEILMRFYPAARFVQMGLNPERELAQVIDNALPTLSFRTYHPNHLRIAKKTNLLDEAISKVKSDTLNLDKPKTP